MMGSCDIGPFSMQSAGAWEGEEFSIYLPWHAGARVQPWAPIENTGQAVKDSQVVV